jgi:large subunit ribosomal protein L19
MNQKVIAFNKAQREERSAQNSTQIPELRSGDVVKIYRRIKEGNKTRTQMFQGMIIAINGGQGSSPSITVRKVSSGVGVELILPLNSPQIEKIEFVKRSRTRRSKLYFVRDKSVKVLSKKLKEIPLSASVLALLNKKQEEIAVPEEVEPEVVESEEVTTTEEAPVEETAEVAEAEASEEVKEEEKAA